MSDFTSLHPDSKHLSHLVDLFLFKGAPTNSDANHPVTVLVNHGYVCGYAPSRKQPVWSAYRVANADRNVDYDRPHLYYADDRLDETARLDNRTFGKHDGVSYDVGHMTPNEVINTQFGRLAQLETFFMSNMCPQNRDVNRGPWLKLETAIRNIEDTSARDHMWVMVGPVFGATPPVISRSDGHQVPVADAFYCITIDPYRYPWDRAGNLTIAAFLIPQDAPRSAVPTDYISDVATIEAATGLSFMPGWDHTVTRRFDPDAPPHRLLAALEEEESA